MFAEGRALSTSSGQSGIIAVLTKQSVFLFLLLLPLCANAADKPVDIPADAVEELWGADLDQLHAITDPSHLQILELSDLSSGGDGAIVDKSLAVLSRYEHLKTLIVSCPQMTDEGLKHIAKLKHLECLIISYNSNITDSGIQELKSRSNLNAVGFDKTPITEKGLESLKKHLKETYFEIGTRGKSGSIFKCDGCFNPRFVRQHFRVNRSSSN